jgi:hypothetical protein
MKRISVMKIPLTIHIGPDTFVKLWKIFWAPILVFTFHLFAFRVVSAYLVLPWLDIPMHYLGGFSMAYALFLGLAFLQDGAMISRLDKGMELILVFTLVATIAVFWEFGEFSIDQVLGTNVQLSLQNTMQDLFMGLLGAGSLIGYKILKRPKQVFVSKS